MSGASPNEDNRVLAFMSAFSSNHPDSPDRARGDEASRLLAAIVEASDDAIVSKDTNGVIMSWNASATRMFGYTAEEVIGKPITLIIPPDRLHEEEHILGCIRRGEKVQHFETVRVRKDGIFVDVSLSVSPVHDANGMVIGASKIARDISERKAAEERQKLLNNEMLHRTKNIFAVVSAIMSRTFATKSSLREAEQAALQRIASLANTHLLLVNTNWQGAALTDVLVSELSPYDERVRLDGPTVMLSAQAAQNFALAVHELATNASKYGALSSNRGRVSVTWHVGLHEGEETLDFQWQESGGPIVVPPERKGFGSSMLQQVMAFDVDNEPTLDFAPGGLIYRVQCPLHLVTNDSTSPELSMPVAHAPSHRC